MSISILAVNILLSNYWALGLILTPYFVIFNGEYTAPRVAPLPSITLPSVEVAPLPRDIVSFLITNQMDNSVHILAYNAGLLVWAFEI